MDTREFLDNNLPQPIKIPALLKPELKYHIMSHVPKKIDIGIIALEENSIQGDDGVVTQIKKVGSDNAPFAYKTYWIRDRAKYGIKDIMRLDDPQVETRYTKTQIDVITDYLLSQYYAQLTASKIYPLECPSPENLVINKDRLVGHLMPWIESVNRREVKIPETSLLQAKQIKQVLEENSIYVGDGELDIRYRLVEDQYVPFFFDLSFM